MTAQALNNLAWMLATCEEPSLRNPAEAVSCARRAVKLDPDQGTYWNTLGVAYFRVQNWDAASEALYRSINLRGPGGDAFDWFFIAMIEAKRGDKQHARLWYDKAVAWFHDGHDFQGELFRFQVESAEALGLPRPPAPIAGKARAGAVPGSSIRMPHRQMRQSSAVVDMKR